MSTVDCCVGSGCRGYHGAVALASDLRKNPQLSISGALDRLMVSNVDEHAAWCASAFVAAQTAADTREWDVRRRRLLAVHTSSQHKVGAR